MKYDRDHWEQLWTKTLRDHGDKVARRPPNAYLLDVAANLPPGRALDAGCGHGGETLWLAGHGWDVTAVDFSESALAHGRTTAEAIGAELAARIRWTLGDLAIWTPPREAFDLVVCLYVHVAGAVDEMVRRMAKGVARGGTILLVGHHPIEQKQVSVADARALDQDEWTISIAEERPRAVSGSGVDALIVAQRRT